MAHNNHVIDGINMDLNGMTKESYIKMIEEFGADDIFPPSEIIPTMIDNRQINVISDHNLAGSKTRFGQWLFRSIEQDTVVYVQPRKGLAGVSILDLAEKFNKRVVLFMPSSKTISDHQAVCIERGAIPVFHRIAAMPNLNKLAKEWADANDAFFIPLGLKHPLVTAGAVYTASKIFDKANPEEVWSVVSTGVLTRALQIAAPHARFHAVAVARNMKAGELGIANVESHPFDFNRSEASEHLPDFPTVNNYDAKAWRYITKYASDNAYFWNVGQSPILKDTTLYERIDSQRDWGEVRNDI